MAYAIDSKTVKEFLALPIRFPRFQRKLTWSDKSNFNLCISICKQYPIGLVVVNEKDGEYWLLDGRQRFAALEIFYTNPELIYNWAKSCIKFRPNDDVAEIRGAFRRTINHYLQDVKVKKSDVAVRKTNGDVDSDEESLSGFELEDDNTFNSQEQERNFDILFDVIQIIHTRKNGRSKLERLFDFKQYIIQGKLNYYVIEDGREVYKVVELVHHIREIIRYVNKNRAKSTKNDGELVSKDEFISYYHDVVDRFINDKASLDFDRKVNDSWDDIYKCIVCVNNVEKLMMQAQVSVIRISKASDLDAQNIFELINAGGTPLTAEELLSAKPFWNKEVENVSTETKKLVKELYQKLNVENQDDVVRWDLCATLMSRIDKQNIIFGKGERDYGIGFRLFAGIFNKGVSKRDIELIEGNESINWETGYEALITDLNKVCELIGQCDYFRRMCRWGECVKSLTSNAAAMEFLISIYFYWKELGCPLTTSSESGRKTIQAAVSLMDRLIYEYSNKMWRGSGDSKLKNDIHNIKERISVISKDRWLAFIKQLADGRMDGHNVSMSQIRPVLYHALFLQNNMMTPSSDRGFEVDHIYPQSLFKNNVFIEDKKTYCDSLTNLEILSSRVNNLKKDKKLNEIHDEDARQEISRQSTIPLVDFDKYSDILNLEDLKALRLSHFLKVFETDRDSMFSNMH